MEQPLDELFDFLPEEADLDELSVADELRLIRRFIWAALGRSVLRLVIAFLIVLLLLAVPTNAILFLLVATGAGAMWNAAAVCLTLLLVPVALVAAFNYVAYRGLRDIVEYLSFGAKIGAEFAAFIDGQGWGRLSVPEFQEQLRGFLGRKEIDEDPSLLNRIVYRLTIGVLFFAVKVVLTRIAKGCLVDGEVDMAQFAMAIGERADGMLVRYLRSVLWDLMRLIISLGMLGLWTIMVIVGQVLKLF